MASVEENWHTSGDSDIAIADVMFCHGTQIMDNSRICHCLLFHEHGKQNFVQPFCLSRKLLRYTNARTKLHNEVMS